MSRKHTSGFHLKLWLLTGMAVFFVLIPFSHAFIPGGTLTPDQVEKYTDDLVIPPVMPSDNPVIGDTPANAPQIYKIAVRQITHQVLPDDHPATTLWAYGRFADPRQGPNADASFNFPAYTIEAESGKSVQVLWVNQLVDRRGRYLPHLLPVDQTLHWANPPMDCIDGDPRTDCRGSSNMPYTGPVPIVTHVHGAHVDPVSDGYPEAWWLPNANNIPAGYATTGSNYGSVIPSPPGTAWYAYDNSQRAATLWYHDHTLGMTRLNVYAGPAGFYLLRDDWDTGLADNPLGLPAPAPQPGQDPNGDPADREEIREVPLAIQDRSFDVDGSLFYPATRDFFEGLAPGTLEALGVEFIPETDVSPIWNPEFFGNMMVVNGKTWPKYAVKDVRYRLRLLNGCNSRFLALEFRQGGIHGAAMTVHQIGTDGGFLPSATPLETLILGPAERADVIIDFNGVSAASVFMVNLAPDEPYGGDPITGFESDPDSTGQVMRFDIAERGVVDESAMIAEIDEGLRTIWAEEGFEQVLADNPDNFRYLSLNEDISDLQEVCVNPDEEILGVPTGPEEVCLDGEKVPFGPISARLGILGMNGLGVPLDWADPITETPLINDTETWYLLNFTADTHPIHLHLVMFQVLGRVDFSDWDFSNKALKENAVIIPPDANEMGWKDTVRANPGQVTLLKAKFDKQGLYVWHCHILEHEDNEMMRPYYVKGSEDETPPEP